MGEKKNCPHTEKGTRTISKSRVVTDNGAEIATLTMSITVRNGFPEKNLRELLKEIAEASRSFYLEVGTLLRTKP